MPDAVVGTERAGPDVALHQTRVLREVVLVERLDLGGRDGGLESLHVDVAVAGDADRQRLDRAVGVAAA